MSPVQRITIINTGVDTTSYSDACQRIYDWTEGDQPKFVVAANVHVVMTAHSDPQYQETIALADLVTPDGMPLVIAQKLLGNPRQTRVAGPDLMWYWCGHFPQVPIFLYGTDQQTLDQLSANLYSSFPTLVIAGSYAPPLWDRATNPVYPYLQEDLQRIKISGARVVFVALGCPKQEFWMAQAIAQAHFPVVFLGVGAAFAIHGGLVQRAPRWMRSLALEWLYRLAQEPRRLWRRYIINNPLFVVLLAWQILGSLCNRLWHRFSKVS
jgi:N-acetylglucosaminyldiphosphoundecaprenol N-acetyl-beta-D-mannosaminyltransferase